MITKDIAKRLGVVEFFDYIVLSFLIDLVRKLQSDYGAPLTLTLYDRGEVIKTQTDPVEIFLSSYMIKPVLESFIGPVKGKNYRFMRDGVYYIIGNDDINRIVRLFLSSLEYKIEDLKKPYKFPNGAITPRAPIYHYDKDLWFAVILCDLFVNSIAIGKDYACLYVLKEPNADEFLAPIEGTFYRAMKPDEPPLVGEGTQVEEGQSICVLEQSKVFSEIPADRAMVILEILVRDNTRVQQGQLLFRIRPIDQEQT